MWAQSLMPFNRSRDACGLTIRNPPWNLLSHALYANIQNQKPCPSNNACFFMSVGIVTLYFDRSQAIAASFAHLAPFDVHSLTIQTETLPEISSYRPTDVFLMQHRSESQTWNVGQNKRSAHQSTRRNRQ